MVEKLFHVVCLSIYVTSDQHFWSCLKLSFPLCHLFVCIALMFILTLLHCFLWCPYILLVGSVKVTVHAICTHFKARCKVANLMMLHEAHNAYVWQLNQCNIFYHPTIIYLEIQVFLLQYLLFIYKGMSECDTFMSLFLCKAYKR